MRPTAKDMARQAWAQRTIGATFVGTLEMRVVEGVETSDGGPEQALGMDACPNSPGSGRRPDLRGIQCAAPCNNVRPEERSMD